MRRLLALVLLIVWVATLKVELYGKQFEFVISPKRFTALVGGIGSGKTIGGVARDIAASQGYIGNQRIQTPNLGVVTAPTYPMLHDATMRTFFEIAGDLVADFNKNERLARMTNGSEILFRSTEKYERLRGPNIAWWHGDEAALYHKDVWRIMIGRLRQGGKVGYAWLSTTPRGRNWIYQEFVQKQRPDYQIWRVRTRENPFVDLEYFEMLSESYAGDFARQELDGEFVAFEGLVYPEFSEDSHVTSTFPAQFVYHVAGVDWGYVHPGVINVYGVDGDGRMWLRHEEVARKRRLEEWVRAALDLHSQYGIQTFFCDTSEPLNIEAFVNAGLPAEGAIKDVLPGIQTVKARLTVRGDGLPRLIYGHWCRHNIAEKGQYQWAENREGFRDMPKKVGDDCSDAERYAVMGVDAGYMADLPGGLNQAAEYGLGSEW